MGRNFRSGCVRHGRPRPPPPPWPVQFRYDTAGRPIEGVLVVNGAAPQQVEAFSYRSDGRKTRLQFMPIAGLPGDDMTEQWQPWQLFIPGTSEEPTAPNLITVLYDAANRADDVLVTTPTTNCSIA